MLCHTADERIMKKVILGMVMGIATLAGGLAALPEFVMTNPIVNYCRGRARNISTGQHWWMITPCGQASPALPEGYALHSIATENYPDFRMGFKGSEVSVKLTSSRTDVFPMANHIVHHVDDEQAGIYHDHLFVVSGGDEVQSHFIYQRAQAGLMTYLYRNM